MPHMQWLCFSDVTPNPSIERTSSSGLRPLPAAAHVKRLALTMLRGIVLLIAALALTSGCASRAPQYTVERDGPDLSAPQAERVLFEKIAQLLRKQIDPPLDQPLTARSLKVPPYPDEVRRANITGVVRIQFKVEPNGN